MIELLSTLNFWGHLAVGFSYATLAIWAFHRYGTTNRQQIILIAALGLTATWGMAIVAGGPLDIGAYIAETMRNLAWLGFMFFLLRSGDGRRQPRTINIIYAVLALLLLCQPAVDMVNAKLIY